MESKGLLLYQEESSDTIIKGLEFRGDFKNDKKA